MAEVVIRAEALSKQYRLGSARQKHPTLRDAISAWSAVPARAVRQRFRGADASDPDRHTIWALRDISFDIEQGDVVGIIGRNGAGKSTLLKILSRIAEPTTGRALLKGRVGSLLEVGTGFHPELTGRENVYLSGSILGMRRREIDQRFSEIVEFAECERFLDTPVKRYSSGMQVRLAFAVAAHLEPEILLVDEVLAVGDVAFQKKCLGRMGDIARQGRTVLFVSHNMAVVQALCRRGILLDRGQVLSDGSIADTVSEYLTDLEGATTSELGDRLDRRGWREQWFVSAEISSGNAEAPGLLATGRPARFSFHLSDTIPSSVCAFTIFNLLGHPVAEFRSSVGGPSDRVDPDVGSVFVCEIDELALVPGRYRIDVQLLGRGIEQDAIEAAAMFDVEEGTVSGRPVEASQRGDVSLGHRWIRPV